jgi:hypothetical protein
MSARYTGGLVYNAPGGWSGLFNGSSQYLSLTPTSALNLSTNNWTIEMWVNLNTVSTTQVFINFGFEGAPYTQRSFVLYLTSANVLQFAYSTDGSSLFDTSLGASGITTGTWNHLAVVRNSTTITVYRNGVAYGTTISIGSSPIAYVPGAFRIGVDGSNYTNGYISNVRVVNGTAVYTSNFTPPNGPLQAITNTALLTCRYPTFVDGSTNAFTITNNGTATVNTLNPFPTSQLPNPALGGAGNGVYTMSQYAALKAANLWPAFDPFYRNVTLNLHGNGTNAAQNNTFLDSSTNNFTITRNGNTTQGTFTPYGANWSNYFDGTSSWNLASASSTAFAFGSGGAWAFEAWVFPTASMTDNWVIQTTDSGNMRLRITTGGVLGWYSDTYGGGLNSSTVVPVNSWSHVAATYDGTTLRLFQNGVLTASLSSGSITNGTTAVSAYIGNWSGGSRAFNGYISNARIVKGSAVYTAAFTPSTTPLTAISGTSLLTCQSNRFIDNSTNSFAITVNGSPSVQRFSPFSPTTAYSTSVIGGSGYFDGSGDYLTAPSTSGQLGSGNFTIECWSYLKSKLTLYPTLWGNYTSFGAGSLGIFAGHDAADTTKYNIAINGTFPAIQSTASIIYNQWTHIALVRSGTTVTLYVNGVANGTATSSATLNGTSGTTYIGTAGDSIADGYLNGYLTDSRVLVGTALYTTAFTPPTAPLTAITNTKLLLNYTNAGIFDNAMMNNLETVGNAQISTSVKKYGTGSMYFDGTGDYLLARSNDVFNFSTGDFTVEFWINASASGSYTQVIGTIVSSNENGTWRIGNRFNSLNQIYFARGTGSGFNEFQASVNVNDGAWHHVAVVRYSGTITIYADGVASASSSITGTCTSANPLYVGYNGRDNAYITGYLDDVRITKGVARYTTNFTPPTSQVQDQ